jgi:hypothetical protein
MDTKTDRATALWAPSRISLALSLLMGVAMLGLAAMSLSFTNLDERGYLGLAAVFMSGLTFGGILDLFRQRRMVHRHMGTEHPGVSIPNRP